MLWKCAAMAKHTIVHTKTATVIEAKIVVSYAARTTVGAGITHNIHRPARC